MIRAFVRRRAIRRMRREAREKREVAKRERLRRELWDAYIYAESYTEARRLFALLWKLGL